MDNLWTTLFSHHRKRCAATLETDPSAWRRCTPLEERCDQRKEMCKERATYSLTWLVMDQKDDQDCNLQLRVRKLQEYALWQERGTPFIEENVCFRSGMLYQIWLALRRGSVQTEELPGERRISCVDACLFSETCKRLLCVCAHFFGQLPYFKNVCLYGK